MFEKNVAGEIGVVSIGKNVIFEITGDVSLQEAHFEIINTNVAQHPLIIRSIEPKRLFEVIVDPKESRKNRKKIILFGAMSYFNNILV